MRSRVSWYASPVLWGILLGLGLGAGLAACASQTPMMPTAEVELRKKEVQDYWMQIRDWRVDIGLAADPYSRAGHAPAAQRDGRCETTKEASTDTCLDVCNLKDAICDNAESICRISKQLEGDTWAQGKCRSARASCDEARQQCCRCTVKEQASAAPLDRKP